VDYRHLESVVGIDVQRDEPADVAEIRHSGLPIIFFGEGCAYLLDGGWGIDCEVYRSGHVN
jgi:hypothetical protein